jgi:hypothetical protein
MAKKVLLMVALVSLVSVVLVGCMDPRCGEGQVWEEGGPNNPNGICKDANGNVESANRPLTPVTDVATAVSDGAGAWVELNNDVVQPAMQTAHESMDASVCVTRYADDAAKMADCASRMANK